MSLTGRGPADQYRGGRPSRGEIQRREEIRRHRRVIEEPEHLEELEEEDYLVAQEEELPVAKFTEPKKKRGRLWRFLIGE